MKLHHYFLVFCFLFSTPINAQVYKCTFLDAVTRLVKVIYTYATCAKSSKQTLTSIQAKSNLSAQAVLTSQQAQATNLDSAVTNAVLNRDFKLAKSLANTKEHWRLIAIAEGDTPPQPTIVANSLPVVSRADECKQAKYNFEYVSRNSWRDRDLVAAKKVSCTQLVAYQSLLVIHLFLWGKDLVTFNLGAYFTPMQQRHITHHIIHCLTILTTITRTRMGILWPKSL